MKTKLIEYLKQFLIQNDWCDKYTKEQARAIFTALCLMEYIDADTAECDEILSYVYEASDIVETIEFDDCASYGCFKTYMLKLIV
jgi:hypothetical protein